jgi:magnesium transporter
MLNCFLFNSERSECADDWRAALEELDGKELLWIALATRPKRKSPSCARDSPSASRWGVCVNHGNGRPSSMMASTCTRRSLRSEAMRMLPSSFPSSVIGPNWLLTSHRQEVAVLEEFLERAEGGGQIGELDAPSFVAAISEWVVASYLRAFEAVETELEELDAKIISQTPRRDVSGDLSKLVDLRRRIGALRRGLAPHREVVVSLQHPELDTLSSEASAQRFANLERRVSQALEAARDTKDSAFGTFDLLVARIGQRTNDIMKVLTLGTVILLPATVLAGVMGMNFEVGLFGQTWLFWAVIALMFLIATLVLSIARAREWI